jgi:hypothetical protein
VPLAGSSVVFSRVGRYHNTAEALLGSPRRPHRPFFRLLLISGDESPWSLLTGCVGGGDSQVVLSASVRNAKASLCRGNRRLHGGMWAATPIMSGVVDGWVLSTDDCLRDCHVGSSLFCSALGCTALQLLTIRHVKMCSLRLRVASRDINNSTQQQSKHHQSLKPRIGSARFSANKASASGAMP